MAEPWESLPDVAADAPAASWEDLPDLPDAPVAVTPAVPRDVAPSITGFTAEDVTADVIAADRTARHTRLRLAFDESRKTSEDDAATTLAVAKQLGVPFDNVRKNLPAFKETAAAAAWDPARWETENPELAKLVLSNPELGPLVLRSKQTGPLVRAFRAAGDWMQDAVRALNEALPVPADTLAQQQAQMQGPDFAAVDPAKLEAANTPLTPEQAKDLEAKRARRDAQVDQLTAEILARRRTARLEQAMTDAIARIDGSLSDRLTQIRVIRETLQPIIQRETISDPRYRDPSCSLTPGVLDALNRSRAATDPAASADDSSTAPRGSR